MWCVADLDDDYIACMEDVLETYEKPYNSAHPVVCLDEKPVMLHADVRSPTSATPGREARYDSEYQRRGTANVFCAVEPKAGRHFTFVTPNRSGVEFAKALFELALAYPEAETIHLVMDNLSTHTRKSLTDLCGDEFGGEIWSCFTPHYTPKHGSWLNQAEIEIGMFSRQCLGKRRIQDLATLGREAAAWNRRVNRDRVKIVDTPVVMKRGRSVSLQLSDPAVEAFDRKMLTPEAQAIYKRRAPLIEFPNAWIKTKLGLLRRFATRGLVKVRCEALWAALTYNLQRAF